MKKLLLIAFALLLPSVAWGKTEDFYIQFRNATDNDISIQYDGSTCWNLGKDFTKAAIRIPSNKASAIYNTHYSKSKNCDFKRKFLNKDRNLKFKIYAGGKSHTCTFTHKHDDAKGTVSPSHGCSFSGIITKGSRNFSAKFSVNTYVPGAGDRGVFTSVVLEQK